jgi:N-acetylneuraminate synthase
METFVIAELGINHNGDLGIAKKLIDGAVYAGADAVKFQKRTVEKVYTKEELDKYRESPWGTTNREQKLGLEFNEADYDEIGEYCFSKKIPWFASAWDIDSQLFLRRYNCKYNKIASAMLTDIEFLYCVASEKKRTFISTGMSTIRQIQRAVGIFIEQECPFEVMHCNSSYPMKNEDANLNVMQTLRDYFGKNIGYSGHETGRLVSLAAVVLGATSLERHITLDKTMYGSDQAASLEIEEFKKLVTDVRAVPQIFGSYEKTISESEMAILKKLRKI